MQKITKMATRDGFGKALVNLAPDYNFIVLSADLAESTRANWFAEKYPQRFVECGIAEANMMCIAAGIATTNTPVFASTFAMFAAGRAFEQIRNSICYPHLNVKIGATHAGLSVGEDGATHQCIEDIALMRSIPGMSVISPCDGVEAMAAVEASLNINGPVYLRLGRAVSEVVEIGAFEFGKGKILTRGSGPIVIATGIMVEQCLTARQILLSHGIDITVVNIHTIKPIDTELLISLATENKKLYTVEEHTIIGGLGSAVLEALSDKVPVNLTRIGVEDKFGTSGTVNELLDLYGLSAAMIAKRILQSGR